MKWLGVILFAAWMTGGAAARAGDNPTGNSTNLPPTQHSQYWFGVAVENISPTIAKQLKLKPNQGLMVVAVLKDSPAEKAGLKAEDLLIEIDGRELTSQDDLARAANTMIGPTKGMGVVMQSSRIAYLREGDRHETDITPAPRPQNMIVSGANVAPFSLNNGRLDNSAIVQNGVGGAVQGNLSAVYALPNGVAAQVGTGYRISLQSSPTGEGGGAEVVKSIEQTVQQGQTVVLSQLTDANGMVTNRIRVGDTWYPVEPGLKAVPAEARPLASQLLTNAGARAIAATKPATLDQRVGELEKQVEIERQQNADLRKQIGELIDLLRKQAAATAPTPGKN